MAIKSKGTEPNDDSNRIVVRPRPKNYERTLGWSGGASGTNPAGLALVEPPLTPNTRETLPPYLLNGIRSTDGLIARRGSRPLNLRELDWYQCDPFLLLDVLPEFSADAARAVWNVVRLGNSGYELDVVNGKTKENDPVATEIVRGWARNACRGVISQILGAHGGFNALVNTLAQGAFRQAVGISDASGEHRRTSSAASKGDGS